MLVVRSGVQRWWNEDGPISSSFIDEWADKIRWTSPTGLLVRQAEFDDTPAAHRETIKKLVLITLIENYASFLDTRRETDVFGDVPSLSVSPWGLFGLTAGRAAKRGWRSAER